MSDNKDIPRPDTAIYWLDLETTGLDPRAYPNYILEVALYSATLADPFTIAKVFDSPIAWAAFDIEHARRAAHPVVRDMHDKNGLWDECVGLHRRSGVNTVLAEAALLAALPPKADGQHAPVLAGSSVHFDHNWLTVCMPTLARYFSHRYLDVSAIKLDCYSQGMPYIESEPAHRAFADIQGSIAHLRSCRAWQRAPLATLVGGA